MQALYMLSSCVRLSVCHKPALYQGYQSTRHKWAQNEAVKRNYLLVGESATETVLTTDGVITASERPPRRKQYRAVTGAASDGVDVWAVLRPTSLQLCEPVTQQLRDDDVKHTYNIGRKVK